MNRNDGVELRRDVLVFGPFRFDRTNRILSREGEELPLPPRALGVLSVLLEDPGSVVSKQALLESVWNGGYVTETSLSEAVRLLRQAFGDDSQEPTYIQTIHRRGYRFIAPVTAEPAVPELESPPPSLPPPPPKSRRAAYRAFAAAVGSLAIAGGLFLAARRNAPVPRPEVTRFSFAPAPEPIDLTSRSLAVSPDGRHVVYVVRRGEETVLFHRDLSDFSSRELAGTRGALLPFFSHDGARVGFLLHRQVLAVPLSGGTAESLATFTGRFAGASWGEDGTLVYAAGSPISLYRVKPDGQVERLTTPDPSRGETDHRWPHLLPGGQEMLFTSWSSTLWDARVEWLSLATGERRTVLTGAGDARYAEGLLVCGRPERAIFAAPFDPKRGELAGPPLPLLREAKVVEAAGMAQVGIGGLTLTYLPAYGTVVRKLSRLIGGEPKPLSGPTRFYRDFQPGPDGVIVASILSRGRSDIWIVDAERGERSTRLTFEGFNIQPLFSRDGQWVVYASKSDGPFNLYRRRADGSGTAERLLESPRDQSPMAWSPDGRELMLRDYGPGGDADLSVLDLATRRVRPFLRTKAHELSAAWSPDGKWIAYTTDETGVFEVYVRGYPEGSRRWQLSAEGGSDMSWSEDGRAIYFARRAADRRTIELWMVPVDPRGTELNPGAARRVYASSSIIFALAGPGGVFVLSEEIEKTQPVEVRVMVNWPAALPSAMQARR
jgi:eukaryotic-like serine/threonine-protein kinase